MSLCSSQNPQWTWNRLKLIRTLFLTWYPSAKVQFLRQFVDQIIYLRARNKNVHPTVSKNKQAKSYVFCFFFFARWIASISRVGSFNEQRHEKKSSKSVFNSFEKRYLANGMRYYVHRLSMFMRTFRKQNLSYIDSKGICLVKYYNRLSWRSDKGKCHS